MSYVKLSDVPETIGGCASCGPGCGCKPCQDKYHGFGERYIKDEDDDDDVGSDVKTAGGPLGMVGGRNFPAGFGAVRLPVRRTVFAPAPKEASQGGKFLPPKPIIESRRAGVSRRISPMTGTPPLHVDPFTGRRFPISATAQFPSSARTAIRPDVGETEAYKAALRKGEVGLQRPIGANDPGPDFITAVRDDRGRIKEIVVSDVKTSGVGRFVPPVRGAVATQKLRVWSPEVRRAVARVKTGNPALDRDIKQAMREGRVRLRQLEVDMSPRGQGTITEAR
jgi:hypothetical protein